MAELQPSDLDLDVYGDMMAASAFGGTALGFVLLGIQIFMVSYGVSAFVSTPKKDRFGRLRFILISCTLLLTSSIHTALDAWGNYRVLYAGGPDGKTYAQAHAAHWGSYQRPMQVADTMGWLTFVQGDVLMLWRCFVLWRDRKWALLVPLSTFVAAAVLSGIALAPQPDWYIVHDRIKLIIAGTAMSVTTNIFITALILYCLVGAWYQRKKAIPDQKSPRMYSSVMAVIIESAAPLTLFGICFVTTVAIAKLHPFTRLVNRGRVIIAADIFNWLYWNAFCALSPQMIIFRVTTGQSWRNIEESTGGIPVMLSKPIRFASTEDTEAKHSESTHNV